MTVETKHLPSPVSTGRSDQYWTGAAQRAVRTGRLVGPLWCLPLILGIASCDGRYGSEPNSTTGAESIADPSGEPGSQPTSQADTDSIAGQVGSPDNGSNSTSVADLVVAQEAAQTLPTRSYPQVTSATEADHMRDDDLVLGVVISGAARAYPWWIMKNFHGVNDSISDVPVLITLCEQCSAAGAFRRVVRGSALIMDMMGIYKGTIILRDRQTRSLWNPFDGVALEGPMLGEKLDRLPIFLTRWDDWKARHPETDVVWEEQRLRFNHGAWYEPGKWGIVNMMGKSIDAWDTRLAENELVYGIRRGDMAIAYPRDALKHSGGVANDSIGPTPIVVMSRGNYEMVGYDRRVGDRTLTFEPADAASGLFQDSQTESLWDIEGNAVRGELAGQRLSRLDGYVAEWHVWFGYHPKTKIFGPVASDSYSHFKFPPLSLVPLNGDKRQSFRLTGKANLVALWAVWCPPCQKELPHLQTLFESYADRGLSVTSIAMHIPDNFEQKAVRQFVAEAKLSFPVFFIDEPSYEQLNAILEESGGAGIRLPTVFVADDEGTVRAVLRGQQLNRLTTLVEELLSE